MSDREQQFWTLSILAAGVLYVVGMSLATDIYFFWHLLVAVIIMSWGFGVMWLANERRKTSMERYVDRAIEKIRSME